jgi:signal transduction histidine kinase
VTAFRWQLIELAGRPFVVRAEPGEPLPDDPDEIGSHGIRTTVAGWFYAPRDLAAALTERSGRPAGFRIDLDGDREDVGPAGRPLTPLPYSVLAFTLRHEDPTALAPDEAGRLGLMRTALFDLGLACAVGGLVTARVLARERRLAALRTAFVSGVSHDLRSPAAAILLLTENLESGAGDPARTHCALRKEAARLRRLVDDVLDFARLERGETPRLAREEVDLRRFVDELERDLGARVAEAGRGFVRERGALPESAARDADALRRALENLVENALKHGRGAVTLAVDADSARVRFAVADEGPGVAAGDRERMFEPFERLGANGHVGGTGLGLAIVRAIARGHFGEARVEGARFTLELPLTDAAEEDA